MNILIVALVALGIWPDLPPVETDNLPAEAVDSYQGVRIRKLFWGVPHTEVLSSPALGKAGCNCEMCMGNHLMQEHGQSWEFLKELGSSHWAQLHYKLHNEPGYRGKQGAGRQHFISHGEYVSDTGSIDFYNSTPMRGVVLMLNKAYLRKTDVVCDLGCGDGRIPIMAAKLYGVKALGMDINPKCIEVCDFNARLNGVEKSVGFGVRDITKTTMKDVNVYTMYLTPALMSSVRDRLLNTATGTRIVSFMHPMPGWSAQGQGPVYAWVIKTHNHQKKVCGSGGCRIVNEVRKVAVPY